MHTSIARDSLFVQIIKFCSGSNTSETQRAKLLDGWRLFKDTILHWPGSKHANVSAMSRRPPFGIQSWVQLTTVVHSYPEHGHDLTGSFIGGSVDLQQAQQNGDDLCPVIGWLKAGTDRPCWEDKAALGSCTHAYWAQWSSPQLVYDAVLSVWDPIR